MSVITRRLYKRRIWREAASLIIATKSRAREQLVDVHHPLLVNRVQDVGNYKLLMLKRKETMKFMPNLSVFPGGELDKSDMSGEWLKCFTEIGINETTLVDSLRVQGPRPLLFTESKQYDVPSEVETVSQGIPLDVAFRISAIRETFEECGIFLAVPASDAVTQCRANNERPSVCGAVELGRSEAEHWQERIAKDGKNLLLLCREKGMCPNLWALREWWNWLTPPHLYPSRFDTMLYIAFVDDLKDIIVRKSESTEIILDTPLSILNRYFLDKIKFAFPQVYDISRMVTVGDFEELSKFAAEREQRGLQCFLPSPVQAVDGSFFLLPGDDMYPKEPDFEGVKSRLTSPLTVDAAREASQNLHRGEKLSTSSYITLTCNINPYPYGHLIPLNGKS